MAAPDRHATKECRLNCGWSGKSNKLVQHEQKPHRRCNMCGVCCTATGQRAHSKMFPDHSWGQSLSILPVLKKKFLAAVFKEFDINPDTIPFATALWEADLEPVSQLEATASVAPRLAAFGSSLEDVPHLSKNQPWSSELRGFNMVYDHLSTEMRTSSAPIEAWEGGIRSDNRTVPSRIMRELAQGVHETQGVIFGYPFPSIVPFFTVPQFLTRKFGIQRHHVRMSANVTLRLSTVDIHHDDGLVMSTLAGGTKLWVVYPPTAHNLLSLKQYCSSSVNLFENSFQTFQHGVLLLQRDGQTIYVPPNCPHFVFTLSSCILYGCEITPPSVFPCRIKSFLVAVASCRLSGTGRLLGFLRHFVDGLKEALMDSPSIVPVLDAWVQEADSIGSVFITDGKAVLGNLEKTWRRFLLSSRLTSCPACGEASGDFGGHFQVSHLAFLPCKKRKRSEQ